MSDVTRFACLLPTFVVGLGCIVFGVLFIIGGLLPPRSEDDVKAAGCGLLLAVFGVVVMAAIGVVYALAK